MPRKSFQLYAQFSNDVYDIFEEGKNPRPPSNYTYQGRREDASMGLYFSCYQENNLTDSVPHYVFAFKGTDFIHWKDGTLLQNFLLMIGAGAISGAKKHLKQSYDNFEAFPQMRNSSLLKNTVRVTTTGHSGGGLLATYIALEAKKSGWKNIECYVYDPVFPYSIFDTIEYLSMVEEGNWMYILYPPLREVISEFPARCHNTYHLERLSGSKYYLALMLHYGDSARKLKKIGYDVVVTHRLSNIIEALMDDRIALVPGVNDNKHHFRNEEKTRFSKIFNIIVPKILRDENGGLGFLKEVDIRAVVENLKNISSIANILNIGQFFEKVAAEKNLSLMDLRHFFRKIVDAVKLDNTEQNDAAMKWVAKLALFLARKFGKNDKVGDALQASIFKELIKKYMPSFMIGNVPIDTATAVLLGVRIIKELIAQAFEQGLASTREEVRLLRELLEDYIEYSKDVDSHVASELREIRFQVELLAFRMAISNFRIQQQLSRLEAHVIDSQFIAFELNRRNFLTAFSRQARCMMMYLMSDIALFEPAQFSSFIFSALEHREVTTSSLFSDIKKRAYRDEVLELWLSITDDNRGVFYQKIWHLWLLNSAFLTPQAWFEMSNLLLGVLKKLHDNLVDDKVNLISAIRLQHWHPNDALSVFYSIGQDMLNSLKVETLSANEGTRIALTGLQEKIDQRVIKILEQVIDEEKKIVEKSFHDKNDLQGRVCSYQPCRLSWLNAEFFTSGLFAKLRDQLVVEEKFASESSRRGEPKPVDSVLKSSLVCDEPIENQEFPLYHFMRRNNKNNAEFPDFKTFINTLLQAMQAGAHPLTVEPVIVNGKPDFKVYVEDSTDSQENFARFKQILTWPIFPQALATIVGAQEGSCCAEYAIPAVFLRLRKLTAQWPAVYLMAEAFGLGKFVTEIYANYPNPNPGTHGTDCGVTLGFEIDGHHVPMLMTAGDSGKITAGKQKRTGLIEPLATKTQTKFLIPTNPEYERKAIKNAEVACITAIRKLLLDINTNIIMAIEADSDLKEYLLDYIHHMLVRSLIGEPKEAQEAEEFLKKVKDKNSENSCIVKSIMSQPTFFPKKDKIKFTLLGGASTPNTATVQETHLEDSILGGQFTVLSGTSTSNTVEVQGQVELAEIVDDQIGKLKAAGAKVEAAKQAVELPANIAQMLPFFATQQMQPPDVFYDAPEFK